MQGIVAALLLCLAAANNIVNPETKKCLQADKVEKGSSLSMQACVDDDVQNFEIIGGRVRTTLGDEKLCLDIKAMCEDGTDVAGCTRQDITKLTEDAEIQLWTCRKDDLEGIQASTYGNQKWDLLANGYFKNELTGLCLVAHHSGEEEGRVHVHVCPDDQTDKEFQLAFETGDMAAATNLAGASRPSDHGFGSGGVQMPWTQSLQAGFRDPTGKYVGGSEISHLAAHGGKLWACSGYWMDKMQYLLSSQVLRLDSPSSKWTVDLDTSVVDLSKVPGATHSYVLRVNILKQVVFTKDKDGNPISETPLLIAAGQAHVHSNGTTALSVFTRDDASSSWVNDHLHPGPRLRLEPRDAEVYEDPTTGEQRLFLLAGELGVISGGYDAGAKRIVWDAAPERMDGLTTRALSLTQAIDHLFLSAGADIWMRNNAKRKWDRVFSMALKSPSAAVNAEMGGIRGLSTTTQGIIFCWAPDEVSEGNIIMINEENHMDGGHEEASLRELYGAYMAGVPDAGSAVQNLGCYNEFYPITDPLTGETVYITGFETLLDGASYNLSWNKYYGGGTYIVRRSSSEYEVHEVNGRYERGKAIPLAPRTFVSSPFAGEEQVLYAAGFDGNWINVHNTAWIFKGGYNAVLAHSSATTTTTSPPPGCQLCPDSDLKSHHMAGMIKQGNPYTAYTCAEAENYLNEQPPSMNCATGRGHWGANGGNCCSCLLCLGKTLKADTIAGYADGRPYDCQEAQAWANSEKSTMTCSAAAQTWHWCCE